MRSNGRWGRPRRPHMEFEFLAVAGVDDAFGPLHVPGRRGGMSNTRDSFGAAVMPLQTIAG
jgi:hypothetical protein